MKLELSLEFQALVKGKERSRWAHIWTLTLKIKKKTDALRAYKR